MRILGDFVLNADDSTSKSFVLEKLKNEFAIDELLYLQTCNRIVFIIYKETNVALLQPSKLFEFINPNFTNSDIGSLVSLIETYSGIEAIKHLFALMSSLESLVVGEREILRQTREAYEFCQTNKLTGDNIRLLMRMGVVCAKDVFTNTRIGDKSVSVVSLGVQKFLRFNLPLNTRILIVGAGQTILLFSKFLKKHGYHNVEIFNRTLENANRIARPFGKKGHRLSELESYKLGFDCMILCTGAQKVLITEALYSDLLQGDSLEKLLIDLSIPYNFDKNILKKHPTSFIGIEELREIAEENLDFRKGEILLAIAIIEKHLKDFKNIYHQRLIERAFQHLPIEIKEIRNKAINVVYKKRIDQLDENAKILLLDIIEYFEKKYVAIPIKSAKEIAIT